MKVGIYDPYLDDLGGGEKYMLSIAAALTDQNDVSLFWDSVNDFKAAQLKFSIPLPHVKLVKNIFSTNTAKQSRITETKDYDVIILLSDGSIPIIKSRKLYIHIQQPIHLSKIEKLKIGLKRRFVSGFFYNSAYTKDYNEAYFGSKNSYLIYPPVRLHPGKVNKGNIIIHVGRFRVMPDTSRDYKKQSVMVQAFKELYDAGFKEWEFIIAVSLPDEKNVTFQKMVASAKGYPISFLINKSNDELRDIYSKAKIYWHASGYGEDLQHNPEFAEHFGITTVEAMGAGAVPVVFNAGGQREIVTQSENGFLWSTVEELKGYTVMLAEDSNLFKKLSENAEKRAQIFSEESFNNKIQALIKL